VPPHHHREKSDWMKMQMGGDFRSW